MEFIVEEIDIEDEQDMSDDDLDVDLNPVPHCPDWKLNPNVECRVMVKRLKSLHTENEVQRDGDENAEEQTETSSLQNENVDSSCGVYRKLKLLVDVLKNCEKREECELCEKYIQQWQQHLIFSHGNNTEDFHEKNSIESTLTVSEPVSLDRNDVPSEKKNLNVKISHGSIDMNSGDELVPCSLTIGSESEVEPFSHNKDTNKIERKSISKGGKSKPFKCETCGKGFLSFYDLTQHKNTHIVEKKDSGNLCRKILQTTSDSNQHGWQKQRFNSEDSIIHKMVQRKEKPHECVTCGKKFLRQRSLTIHKLSHKVVKSYKCDVCGKCFAQNTHLTTHKIAHTGEKQYPCELCGEVLAQLGHLTRHILTHPRETPHKCKVYGKCFLFHSALGRHKVSHTGVKPYKCDVCGKCFDSNGHLTQHKLIHTGEKPYKCELCGKCFTQKHNLTRHIRTHTGERPYKCRLCGKSFFCQTTLRRHTLTHT